MLTYVSAILQSPLYVCGAAFIVARLLVEIMTTPANSNESYCTFTLALDVTAGGLPSEEEIAKDLESNDTQVRLLRRIGTALYVQPKNK